jgi:hypothetical protein
VESCDDDEIKRDGNRIFTENQTQNRKTTKYDENTAVSPVPKPSNPSQALFGEKVGT